MKTLLLGLLVVALVAIAVPLFVSGQFRGKIEGWRKVLSAAQTSMPPDQDTIPQLMRAFALRNGATVGGPATMMAHQSVEMKTSQDQPFIPVAATQLFGTRDPGFVWEATATMALVVPVRVVDAYAGGAGWLEVRIAGAIPMVNATGPESDKGEMMRFLAELAWNPEAILNAAALEWRQIDERTVEVSIETGGGIAAVRHLFDESGDIIGIEADDRPYLLDGKTIPVKWIGRFRDYATVGKYRLPRSGEIAWVLPEGEYVYWRGTVTGFAGVEDPAG